MQERKVKGSLPSEPNRAAEKRPEGGGIFQAENFVPPKALTIDAVECEEKI